MHEGTTNSHASPVRYLLSLLVRAGRAGSAILGLLVLALVARPTLVLFVWGLGIVIVAIADAVRHRRPVPARS